MAGRKKAAPAVEESTDDAPIAVAPEKVSGVQESAIQLIPYGRLKRAPENVRKTDVAADVESLADDIAAHGLLQSLIGYEGDTSIDRMVVWIVGGGRRLQALALLREKMLIDDAFQVPVLIRPQGEAIEVSLSENLARRDMNPADEFTAFAALMQPGTLSPADLAKRFGFTERYVKQRLRLAGLCEEVLDALRAGRLTIDAALAYAATQDQKLQAKVFATEDKKTWGAHHATNIRSAIINAQMTTGSGLFKFVTAADYEKKGGRYEDDLFGEAECYTGRKLIDPDIVTAIAADRAHFQMTKIVADAKAAHPSTSDVLLAPGLALGRKPKPPKGYDLVERPYWRQDVPDYPALRDRASAAGIDIVGIASITHSGALRLEEQFFVPGARLAEVIPAQRQNAPARDWEAERRATAIESCRLYLAAQKVWAAFKAEEISGRIFWASVRPRVHAVERAGLGLCHDVGQAIIVTQDELDAIPFEDAEAEYLRQEEEKVARAAAAEQAKAAAAAAREARRAELIAMDPPPAVVLIERIAHYRWDNGAWCDEPEDGDVEPELVFDDLEEALEGADDIGAAYASVVDYHAAIAASNGDEPETDAADQDEEDLAA